MLDWKSRRAAFIGRLGEGFMAEILGKLAVLIEDEGVGTEEQPGG
jgi:hypothetical protein